MAIYELEERVFFDGGLPADIVEIENTSEQNLENSADNTDTADNNNSENVSIAPKSNSDNSDNTSGESSDSDDSENTNETLSDVISNETIMPISSIESDDITAILDSIDDTTITDNILADQNFLIISSDNKNLDNITDSLNDNTTLIVYDSNDTFDSIIQKLKTELGDSKAVNIGILNSEKIIDNSENCNDFLDNLKELQYFDGEINILEIGNDTETDQLTTNNNSWTAGEDTDALTDYFLEDSDFITTDNQHLSTNNEIVFINSSVMDAEEIIDDLSPDAEIVYLTKDSDALQQITDYLAGKTDIDTIRIISHGNEGYFVLNGEVIDAEYLAENSEIISSWKTHLSEDADIMLYGCNLAATAEGKVFVNTFADLTGADVAASIDSTGISGNWNLEYCSDAAVIETAQIAVSGYNHNLTNYLVTNTDGQTGESAVANSLAWAVNQTNLNAGADEITFDESLDGSEIILSSTLNISDDVTISGNGMGDTNISTVNGSSVFYINDGDNTNQISFAIENISLNSADSENMFETTENITVDSAEINENYYLYVHNSNTAENPKVLLVSSNVKDFETFNDSATDNVIVIQYAPGQEGLEYITDMLENVLNGKKASSIGIVTHKDGENEIELTLTETMNLESVLNNTEHQEFWQNISANITEDGRIDLFACDLASAAEGIELVSAIEAVADINAAASTDSTGSESAGGNWILETDNINLVNEYFKSDKIDNYYFTMDDGYENGDYKTQSGGHWSSYLNWEKYNGFDWNDANSAPDGTQNIYIYNIIDIDDSESITISATLTVLNSGKLSITESSTLKIDEGASLTINGEQGITVESGSVFRNPGTTTITDGSLSIQNGGEIWSSGSLDLGTNGSLTLSTATENIHFANPVNFTAGSVKYGGNVDAIEGTYFNLQVISGTTYIRNNITVSNNFFLMPGQNLEIIDSTFTVGALSSISGNITISETGKYIANDTFSAGILGMTLDVQSGSTLELGSTVTATSDYFEASAGIIEYAGSSQTIFNAVYNNLTISGASVSSDSDLTINGDLVITGTGNFNAGSHTYTAGTADIDGTLSISSGTVTVSGSSDIDGTLEITSTGTYDVNGSFDATGGNITFTGNGKLKLGGATVTSLGTLTSTKGTVYYDRNGNQSVLADSYYNLIINGSGIKTLNGTASVGYDLEVSSGAELAIAGRTLNLNNSGRTANIDGKLSISTGTVNASGSSDIDGTLEITSTGTYDANGSFDATNGNLSFTGAGNLKLGGITITSLGNLSGTDGTVWYDRAGDQTVLANTYFNLKIDGGSGVKSIEESLSVWSGLTVSSGTELSVTDNTLTLNCSADIDGTLYISTGTVDVSGSFDATNGNITFTGDGNLKLGGATVTSLGTLSEDNGTVWYDRAGNQTVLAATYYNLNIGGGSGTKAFNGTLTVANNLTVYTGTVLAVDDNTLIQTNSSGTTDIDGNISITSGTVTVSGSSDIDGNLQITSTGTYDADGSFDATNGNITFTGDGNLKLGGETVTNLGTLSEDNGTVWYDRVGDQTVFADNYYNLRIDGGSGTKSFNGTISVANNLAVNTGTELAVADNTLNVNSSSGTADIDGTLSISTGTVDADGNFDATNGNITFTGDGNLKLGGETVTNLGTLSEDNGTVWYDRAGDQTVFADNYYNLRIDGGSGTKSFNGTISVANNLAVNTGTELAVADNTLNVSSSSGTADIDGTLSISTGTVTVSGSSDIDGILEISSNGTYDADGSFDATNGSISFTTGHGNLMLGGTTVTSLGTLDSTRGTVWYDRNGDQTVLADWYYNLVIEGSGIKFLNGIVNIKQDLTISDGNELNVADHTLKLLNSYGTADIEGTLSISTGTVDTEGNIDATDGNITFTGDGNLKLGGETVTSLGTLSVDNGTVWYDRAGNQTVFVDSYYNLNISGGSGTKSLSEVNNFVANNLTITAETELAVTGYLTVNNSTGIAGTLSISTGKITVYGNSDIDGTLQIGSGIYDADENFDAAGGSITFTGNGSLLLGGETILSLGTLSNDKGFVKYDRNGSQTILADDYYNLYAIGGGTKSLNGSVTVGNYLFVDSETELTVADKTLLQAKEATNGFNIKGVLSITTGMVTVSNNTDISGTMQITSTGTYDADGNFDATNGNITFTGNGNLKLGGETVTSLGTLSEDNGTVWYDRDGDQTVFADNYYNLKISESGIKSLNGTVAVANNLTVNTGTELAVADNTLNVSSSSGTADIDGNLSISTGTVTVSGSSDIDGNLQITSIGTYDADGNFNAANGNITFTGDGNLKLGGETVTSLGTLSEDNGTVWYDRAEDQTVFGDTYYNLTISGGSGIKTLGGEINIDENLVIAAGTTLDVSDFDYQINAGGNWTNSGIFLAKEGNVIFNGTTEQSVTANGSDFYDMTVNSTVSMQDDLTVAGQLNILFGRTINTENNITLTGSTTGIGSITATEGVVTYSRDETQSVFGGDYHELIISGSGTRTLGGIINIEESLTIESEAILSTGISNYDIYIAGDWTNSGNFIAHYGRVLFDGDTDQSISGTTSFNNLTIVNTGDPSSVAVNAAGSDLTVSNLLDISDGKLISASDYHNVNIMPDGILELSGDITVSGNWQNSGGVFTPGINNVTFDGDAQTIYTETFYSLTISGTGTKNLSGTITATQGILVDSSVTLQGSSNFSSQTILQASDSAGTASDRVLYIYNENSQITVNISYLTVRYGNGAADGGGIYNNGEIVNISNSTVSYNTAAAKGGGLYNAAGGCLTVSCSTVNNNSSGTDGSGLANYGTLILNNSTIAFNNAAGSGGGLYLATGSVSSIDSCTIAYNHSDNNDSGEASVTGGGIYSDSDLSVLNSIIVDNYKGSGTGSLNDYHYNSGILTDSGYNIIKYQTGDSLFSNSTDFIYTGIGNEWTHDGRTITGSLFMDNALANNGGPTQTLGFNPEDYASIAWENGYTTLTTDQRGVERISPDSIGAYAFAAEYFTTGNGTNWNDLESWVVSDGFVYYSAQHIPEAVNSTSITIRHDLEADISLDIGRVTIYSGFTLTINDDITLTLVDEASTDLTIYGVLTNSGSGSLICETNTLVDYAESGNQTIFTSDYYNLTISGGSDSIKTLSDSLTINGNLNISSETRISAGNSSNTIFLKGNWNNSGTFVSQEGTVILNGTSLQTITDTNFASFYNLTLSNSSGAQLLSNIEVDGTYTLDKGTFYVNSNTINLNGAADINSTLYITTGNVNSDNSFDATGGNIVFNGSGNLYLSNTVTSLGSLTASSGTVIYNGDDQHIDNLDTAEGEFYYNLILKGSGTKTFNGITTATNGIIVSDNVTVSGNTAAASETIIQAATSSGAATGRTLTIYSDAAGPVNVTLQNITVRYGNADNGGGIYNNGEILSLYNVTVTGNTAAADAGGILNNGTLTVYYSTIQNNAASLDGGGIVNNTGAVIYLHNSTVSGNEAGVNGAGINNEGSITIINSTVSGNKASGLAGGIYAGANSTTIISSTIANNYSDYDASGNEDGGGIYLMSGTLNISNSIIANNYQGNDSTYRNDFYNDSGTLTDSGYNIAGYSCNSSGRMHWSSIGDWNWSAAGPDSNSDIYTSTGAGGESGELLLSGKLSDNGGPVFTLAVGADSIAAGAIPSRADGDTYNGSVGIDQRGYYRTNTSARTIGAYEYGGTAPDNSDYLTRYMESGSWRNSSLWMQYSESTGWYNANTAPDNFTVAGRVTITYGSSVTVLNDLTINETVIEYGASLGIDSITNDQTLRVAAGTLVEGADLLANGTLTVAAGDTLLIGSGAIADSNGIFSVNGTLSFDDYSGNDDGKLYISASIPTINALTVGNGTVIYDGTNQTVAEVDYNNLTLSGTGSALLNSITVNGIFSLESTSEELDITGSVVYGTSATLNYGVDRTATGVELDGNPPNITIADNANIIFNRSINTNGDFVNTGIITVNNDPDFTITAEEITTGSVTSNVDGGNITFDATSGNISLNGNITANNGNISFEDHVILTANSEVNSNGGNIVFDNGINGPEYSLTLDAGDGTVDIAGDVSVNNLSITENGNITQSGIWDIYGTLDLDAGNNDIILNNINNDFSGIVNASGNDITLTDINTVLLGNITADSGTLTITAGDGATQAAGTSLTADNLLLLGSGDFILNNSGNNISVLAVNINGNFSFRQDTNYEIGTIGPTEGVNVTQNCTLLGTATVSQTKAVIVNSLELAGGGVYNLNLLPTTINGNLTIGSSTTLNLEKLDLHLTHNYISSGIFNSTGTLILDGFETQEINGGRHSIYNLEINNSAGIQLTGDTSIENQLILSSGIITLGAYNLALGSELTILGNPSDSNMILTNSSGSVRKRFTKPGEFLFPIGTNSRIAEYSPITIAVTKGSFSNNSYIEARVTDSKLAENTSSTNYLKRYWTTGSAGITSFSANVTCNYLDTDIVGNENAIWGANYTDTWIRVNRTTPASNSFSGTITSFGILTGADNSVFPVPESGRPSVYNGMMINDATQFQTATSWRNSIDDGAENSIDSDEGFEPNEVEGIGLLLDSLITFDASVRSVANGEYSMSTESSSGVMIDGEYSLGSNSDYGVNGEYSIENASAAEQEFNSQYDGIIDLSFNFEGSETLINYEAIAAYNGKHPLFKTELDLLLEKI